jgi:pre-mRNA-processing factor SLU7
LPAADDADLDPEKVKAAMKRLEQAEREAVEAGTDERKRKFNSVGGGAGDGEAEAAPTPEEMEAYRMKKQRAEDPTAAFTGNNGVSGTDGYDML